MAENPLAKKPVLFTLPGMNDVVVRADVAYQLGDGGPLTFDLYSPVAARTTRPPVVVLVSGGSDRGMRAAMGCRFKEMGSTTSWARLIAASGMAAVAYSNREPEDLHLVLKHLRHYSESLGIDAGRIGVWASSGNAPMAMSALMDDRDLKCGAFLYGYLLDADGTTLVADTLKTWGFANPAAGKSVALLRADLPLFIARAGLEHFPHLNAVLDHFVLDGFARNMPLTVVNHATGHHAFDLLDDNEETREVIAQVLAFLASRLRPERLNVTSSGPTWPGGDCPEPP